MNRFQQQIAEFHQKFGQPIGATPLINPDRVELRSELIREEAIETMIAMKSGDLVGVADGIVDLIYVAIGAAVEFGIDIDPIFDIVHAANMAKEGGGTRADGKILKPPGWKSPDTAILVELANQSRGGKAA